MEEEVKEERVGNQTALMAIIFFLLLIIVGGGAFYFGSRKVQPTPSPTSTPTGEATASPEASPEGTLTPSPTATKSPSPTPTPSPTPEAKADLYISEYSFDHPPKQGEAFTFKIGIYNQGNKAAGGFWWEWWATISAPSYACRQRIDSLAAHGGRIVYCTYTYGGWANYTTKAVADTDNEVPESDEANNAYTQNVIPIH